MWAWHSRHIMAAMESSMVGGRAKLEATTIGALVSMPRHSPGQLARLWKNGYRQVGRGCVRLLAKIRRHFGRNGSDTIYRVPTKTRYCPSNSARAWATADSRFAKWSGAVGGRV